MAIDYDSGSGLFDKLGPLVRVINLFESFETGDLQTKLTAIYNKLETANEYDDRARLEFYRQDSALKSMLRSWKQDMVSLVTPILTQEMHEGESFYSKDINELLAYLKFCMLRDSETVDGSTITVTGPAAGTNRITGGTIVGNFSVVASKYYPTAQGADSSSQENGIIRQNSYVIHCIQNAVSGGETFRVEGDLPLNGLTHPSWQNVGNAGTLQAISSISNTLLTNGGMETLNTSANGFANWTVNTGTYATDFERNADPYRGTYALKFLTAKNGKMTQTLATDTLKPFTKYLITLKAKKANSADGTLTVGFGGTTGCFWTLAAASLTTSYVIYSHFFNTGSDPGAVRDFYIERVSATAGEVFIDEITLTAVPLIHGLGLAVIAGSIDPAIGDFWTCTPTANAEGTFQRFFGRWFNFLLPGDTGGTETIADSLAE